MKIRLILATAVSVVGLCAHPLHAQEKDDLRKLVQQWVEVMSAIQSEEDEWTRDREVLQNFREGLKSEISTLKEQIKDAEVKSGGATSEQAKKIDKKDDFEAAKENLSSQVIALEEKAKALIPLVPDPLLENQNFKTALERFKNTVKESNRWEMKGAPARLQTVIQILSELEKFQNTVTVRTDTREATGGKTYEVQFIYLGLAKAYAVNEGGTFALVGEPGADGWSFREDNTLAPKIQTLIAATTGDADAQFINMPLSIQ